MSDKNEPTTKELESAISLFEDLNQAIEHGKATNSLEGSTIAGCCLVMVGLLMHPSIKPMEEFRDLVRDFNQKQFERCEAEAKLRRAQPEGSA